MEDILASIKRVIAEDGRAAARPTRSARPAPPPPPPPSEDDVLELSDPVVDGQGLVSEDAAAASARSLAALSALKEAPPASAHGEGPLEAVVREMLKPMLKDWLDHHLPDMVEELVTREIARITGKHF